jgi:conjugative element/phage-associated large polyvalent protein/recombinase
MRRSKDIGRRVRNKLQLLARTHRPAGGRAYGYIPASRIHSGQVEKNEAEAAMVLQIFKCRSEGRSGKTIAQELNAQKIPAPGACWNRRVDTANRKRFNGDKVTTRSENTVIIHDLSVIAKARRWDRVEIGGTESFKREAWRAARLAGFEVIGYKPTALKQA